MGIFTNSTLSSNRRIERVSSDNLVVAYDLVSHLVYMSVLSLGGLPRENILEKCGQMRLKTAVFFEYIFLMAKRMGVEYTQAFQMVAQKAKASNVKSLLLRFSASISSGESESGFVTQEAKNEIERYTHEYERNVENLRKWTDAYAAMMFSVILIMVVSLVSTMIGFFNEAVVLGMAATVMLLMAVAVYIILRVAPVEETTYETSYALPRERRLARRLLVVVTPVGAVVSVTLLVLLGSQISFVTAVAILFLVMGVSMAPAGFYAWRDSNKVSKLDEALPTFLRTMGNVAGATGRTLQESLRRIDMTAMGTMETHASRLQIRLAASLPSAGVWEAMRGETGSELVNRSTHMLVDGIELGGPAADVGKVCSDYAMNVTQLRAQRSLTANSFAFLTVPMHGAMVFVMMFVLGIISNFNSRLNLVSAELIEQARGTVGVPGGLDLPKGISIARGGELPGALDVFGGQDIGLISVIMIGVVFMLTFANSVAPKFATGGDNLKLVSFLSVMCVVTGIVLAAVPPLTNALFPAT